MGRFVLMALSAAVFGLSLALPAIFVSEPAPNNAYGGGICLLTGWLSLLEFWPMWLANPLLLACLIFLGCKKYGIALGLGLVAIALALCSLTITEMLRDEGGTMVPVTGFGSGFYLWLLSMVIPTVGSLVLMVWRRKAAPA
jgi:hypothetical protein